MSRGRGWTRALKEAADQGLYRPDQEHDSCGVGFVAHLKGEASHGVIIRDDALSAAGFAAARRLRDRRGPAGSQRLL